MKKIIQLLFIAVLAIAIFSCQKEEFTTSSNVKLEFSTDTVSFDTVFTTIGSTTQYFLVRNTANKAVTISDIYLAGGDDSPYRLNINGVEATSASDVELYSNDSLFIFVEVTIDPTNQDQPLVVQDSIIFNTNGNTQKVQLVAFGQDFHLFSGDVISSQHWINDKPYLIYNYVILDSLKTLTIDPGCQIYFHKKASLFIKGTLEVNGTYEEPVTFLGDRLEDDFDNLPSQWGYYTETSSGSTYFYGGLHFLVGSQDNVINYAVIKNANKGIEVDSLGASSNPVLTLNNTRIENMSLYCLDARSSSVTAYNCLFANSGSYSLALLFGGDYEFNHCTVANYYRYDSRSEAAVILNNYYTYDDVTYAYSLNSATFNNCIFYGSNTDELSLDNYGPGDFNYEFNYCSIKTSEYSSETDGFSNCFFNENPEFVDAYEYNYSLDSLSPARDIGDPDIAALFPLDLNNNSRLADDGPDLGALEWVSKEEEE